MKRLKSWMMCCSKRQATNSYLSVCIDDQVPFGVFSEGKVGKRSAQLHICTSKLLRLFGCSKHIFASPKPRAVSSSLTTPATSEQSSLCSVFLCRKTSACFLAPPLSQKGNAFSGALFMRFCLFRFFCLKCG